MSEEQHNENLFRIAYQRNLLKELHKVHKELLEIHGEQVELLRQKRCLLMEPYARPQQQRLIEQQRLLHLLQDLHARQSACLQEERVIIQEFRATKADY